MFTTYISSYIDVRLQACRHSFFFNLNLLKIKKESLPWRNSTTPLPRSQSSGAEGGR